MPIDKQKLQKLLWSEVASWKADCGEWKQNAEALGEFLGEKTVEEVALELLAENEALRKDADRYRWLRSRESAEDPEISVTRWTQLTPDRAMGEAPRLEVLDAAIDAAMGKGGQS
ncbi:hypothetical protein M1M11_31570 [Pseudomonas azerbaijanoccidens]|uniref:hypothetical protein n=1 Tax=Pseudomonas azerbaijanoccidentalis TaxID=2842347 RepID=UPI00200B37B2|nr:hypothetical protein [Pseudomonas azerbaijanoccidentalis]MCK8669426.1 hypothetical protein [Pseudomonas azerbaijanoccidentalis]